MRAWLASLLLIVSSLAGAQEPYTVDAQQSRIEVQVGRAGLFKIFGHDHRIRVERFSGEVTLDEAAPERSRFTLDIDAASLVVADPEVSEEDRTTIQADMEAKALDLPQHPRIVFTSTAVELRGSREGRLFLNVKGRLVLRGIDLPLEVPLELELAGDRLVARGELELGSDAWGVPQIAAAGGAVKTSKDLGVTFEILATRSP